MTCVSYFITFLILTKSNIICYTYTYVYFYRRTSLKEEGSQLVSNTNQLKLEAADGKKYRAKAVEMNLQKGEFVIYLYESVND